MTDLTTQEQRFMGRALELAEQGRYTAHPNPVVGCVLVAGNEVVGEGFHRRNGENHAEINALLAAGNRANGATAYVTLEPCNHQGRTPPCSEALIAAGVSKVVYAMEDPNPRVAGAGIARLKTAGVETRYLDTQGRASALNPGFVSRMQTGLPWVRVKLASSLDGGTALENGDSRWITGESARADVHRWRGRSGAIVTGIGTLLADDPRLTVRLDQPTATPLRVVLDSRGRMPMDCELLRQPGPVLQCVGPAETGGEAPGLTVETLPLTGQGLDLGAMLELLGRQSVNEVWVEAGSRLASSFLRAGLVDELIIYLAPVLLGEGAMPLLRMPSIENMEQRHELELVDLQRFDGDVRLTYRPSS